MTTTTKPAVIELEAPERLTTALAAIGYDVKLIVTRNGKMLADPDADADPIDAPIAGQDLSNLRATIAAYEVSDKPDPGPRFEPPKT